MTSAYRRDHITDVSNDEFDALNLAARLDIVGRIDALDMLYPDPVASNGEKRALQRAFARYLIDSGKASQAGVLA
jgi:hypothetical protein